MIEHWSAPEWARERVFYQIFPDRFFDGDPANDPPQTVLWDKLPTRENFFGGDLAAILNPQGDRVVGQKNFFFFFFSAHPSAPVSIFSLEKSIFGTMYIMKIYIILSISCCKTYIKFQLNTHDRLATILKIRILGQILAPCRGCISVLDDETTTFFRVPQVFPLR